MASFAFFSYLRNFVAALHLQMRKCVNILSRPFFVSPQSAYNAPPPGAHLLHFGGKKSSTTKLSTCRKPLNRYQKILSELLVITCLTITLKWSVQRWICSYRSTNIQRFVNQNRSGPRNTLTKPCSHLVCKSFRCLRVLSPYWTTLLTTKNSSPAPILLVYAQYEL
jgi:hypothetical protein